jgi:hypothetical protein
MFRPRLCCVARSKNPGRKRKTRPLAGTSGRDHGCSAIRTNTGRAARHRCQPLARPRAPPGPNPGAGVVRIMNPPEPVYTWGSGTAARPRGAIAARTGPPAGAGPSRRRGAASPRWRVARVAPGAGSAGFPACRRRHRPGAAGVGRPRLWAWTGSKRPVPSGSPDIRPQPKPQDGPRVDRYCFRWNPGPTGAQRRACPGLSPGGRGV